MISPHSSAANALQQRPVVWLRPSSDQKPRTSGSDKSHAAGMLFARFLVVAFAATAGVGVAVALRSVLPSLSTETAIAAVIAGLVMLATMSVAIRILSREAL